MSTKEFALKRGSGRSQHGVRAGSENATQDSAEIVDSVLVERAKAGEKEAYRVLV